MAYQAIRIKLIGSLSVSVGLADFTLGLMLVLMMPKVLCLRSGAFVRAIDSHRRPAELEGEQCKQENCYEAAHFLSLAREL
ncbi:MAG: hypothetical protein Q7K57_26565 [Burkholderiaceae bacterium]|nr:hypothetical protein [Burkholderiaceae bacterium]